MRQAGLFGGPPVVPGFVREERPRFLRGLNVEALTYPRDASARIAALDRRVDVEAALLEVPVNWTHFVESLVVMALAKRVACAAHDKIRELLLAEVPEYLLARVRPLAKSYEVTRPWQPVKGEA